MARRDEFAVLASRTVIDREFHLDGGMNRLGRQCRPIRTVRQGLANENVLESGQPDDIAGVGLGHFDLSPSKW